MVKDKTVIVVGAGASNEFNLPIGSELLYQMSRAFHTSTGNKRFDNEKIHYALENYARTFKPHDPYYGFDSLVDAAKSITKAIPLSISIDNLIDERKDADVEVCAKIGIAKTILDAERNSTIYCAPGYCKSLNFENSKKTWLNHFFKIIKQNCEFDNLPERLSQVKFIVFNYDRCVEHYIYYAIQNAYNVNEYAAKECMKYLEVYHPYGRVGSLPWMEDEHPFDFGYDINPEGLVLLVNELKTFTEGIDSEESEIDKIRNEFLSANIILFLGFAYHPLNLKLLMTPGRDHNDIRLTHYYGTSYGYSGANTESIKSDLQKMAGIIPENITIRNDLRCFELFNEYWRLLSLSDI